MSESAIIGVVIILAPMATMIGLGFVFASQRSRMTLAVARAHEVAERQLAATDEFRRGLSADLHDDLLQRIYGLSLDAEAAAIGLPEVAARLRAIATDLRAISHTVYPPLLAEVGLVEALEAHIAEWQPRSTATIALRRTGERPIPEGWRSTLFRWFQEAMGNAIRHARASQVVLSIEATPTALVLRVDDDGIGFDLEAPGVDRGLGLRSLQHRLHLIGGKTVVVTTPGGGTRVRGEIPWPT